MSPPSIPVLLVSHWQSALAVDLACSAAAAAYLWGARRVRRGWPLARTLGFLAGLGAVLLALQSGLGTYDDQLLSVHMVQHLILLVLAPVLILAGAPDRLILASLGPGRARRAAARAMARVGAIGGRALPVLCLLLFSLVVLATHVPSFYDATLSHPALHELEHAAYLTVGLILWWPVMGGAPSPARRLNGFLQLVYVIAAMLPMELIGAYLSRAPSLLYPAYAAPAHALGLSAVTDQQHAGAIMWVLGGFLMVLVVMWTATRAMVEEERRQQARDRYAGSARGTR